MLELPEASTIARQLRDQAVGHRTVGVVDLAKSAHRRAQVTSVVAVNVTSSLDEDRDVLLARDDSEDGFTSPECVGSMLPDYSHSWDEQETPVLDYQAIVRARMEPTAN